MDTNQITKTALKELKWRGSNVWRQNNIKVRGRAFIGMKGLPDIIGHNRQGVAVYCEVKGKGDKLSQDQVNFLTNALLSGCITLIATIDHNDKFILKEFKGD